MTYFSDDIPKEQGDWFIDGHGEYIHRMEFARPPYERINKPLWDAIQEMYGDKDDKFKNECFWLMDEFMANDRHKKDRVAK